jgi:aminoglycoside 6'-N-acetyltransferase
MLIEQDEIAIRLMEDEIYDYQLMAKWLTDAQVLEFYEGRDNPFDLERIIETYKPMLRGDDPVIPCLFYYRNIPIGYLQYCALMTYPKLIGNCIISIKLIMSTELTCS